MNLLLFVSFLFAKQIIEFPELEKRSPDAICQEYQTNYAWKKQGPCYTEGEGCTYGTHSQEDIDWTVKRVNFFRKLTGLSTIPVSTNTDYLNKVNQASLVMEKNNIFSHDLKNQSLECWSNAAQEGASSSNIFWASNSACSTNSIQSYIDDSNTPSLGHRRWILNPPLTEVASGVAEHYSALLVMGEIASGPNSISKFLAYPPPGPVPSDLIFKYWSFSRNYTKASDPGHKSVPGDLKVRIKCNDTVKSLNPSIDTSNQAMYPGMAKFEPPSAPAGTYCKVILSSDSEDVEWRYTILSIKCNNGKAENVNPDAFSGKDDGYDFDGSDDKDDGGDDKKDDGGGSSSNKDNDDPSELSAKSLGDFKISSCFIGTSSNIHFNLNLFSKLMKKLRLKFGRAVPSPDFVHSAIWVGQNDSDESVGAIFVYGKYWNRMKLNSYIEKDGAKAFVMTLGEFKKRYSSIQPMKLNVHKNLGLFEFIEKVSKSGNWRVRDYNWPTNNCQHFTAKLIDILKATRANPGNNDWMDLPKLVLNSLKENEDSFLK